MNTYGDRPLTFVKGQGCWLWDDKGNAYLDALGLRRQLEAPGS